MFAFGYALGPIYDVLCAVTGIGGKTGVISAERAAQSEVAEDRWVKIEFVGTVTAGLPWNFSPVVHSVRVRPGEAVDAAFVAVNKSSRSVVGQAVPSVAPQEAARHFKKTECFCFVQQTLASGEEKEMPLRFLVDIDLPEHVHTITLSYAFFNADKYAPEPDDSAPSGTTHKNTGLENAFRGIQNLTVQRQLDQWDLRSDLKKVTTKFVSDDKNARNGNDRDDLS